MVNPNDMNLQETFRKAIIDNGVWRGISSKVVEQKAQEILTQIQNDRYDDSVWQRYALVGGTPLSEYINHKNFFGRSPNYADYSNTCALQVSYALNYGGMPLKDFISRDKTKRPKGFENITILQGTDNYDYITGVINVINLLQLKSVWGDADKPYNSKIMITKQENIIFYNSKFSKFSKSGVVAMIISGWGDANGHITLWSGKDKKFLDNSNYLLDSRDTVIVKKLYFWELL